MQLRGCTVNVKSKCCQEHALGTSVGSLDDKTLMSGSISSSFRVYSFLPLLFNNTVHHPGYIVSVAFTATLLLFTGQLTVTPGSSQRSTGLKGRQGWKALGCECLAATSGLEWLFKHLMLDAMEANIGETSVKLKGLKPVHPGDGRQWLSERWPSALTVMEMMKTVKDEVGTECTTTAKSICTSLGLSWYVWVFLSALSMSVSVFALEPQPTPNTESWWLFDSRAGRQMPPRPAETFMKHYDPLLHLMYPNRPLWLLSSLASP